MTLASIITAPGVGKCPVWQPEFNAIRANHATLASTGCTKEICQAGRAVHTDEPRVGENRALHAVEREAKEFLEELYREGIYENENAFSQRLEQALAEIRSGASTGVVREDHSVERVGGTWLQTPQELEFGVRRAWRNSRKCIMRSHCEDLKLCDLRKITSSVQMAAELIEGVQKAFNQGSIRPTVFVFPPRTTNCRGPMIMNHQVLQLAGYEADDGSIVGDPASVELTKTIIDLGWKPPEVKSRWDVLPFVTMAEGDRPCIAELPTSLRKLVDIHHPQFPAEFKKLNLKWVPFPALTQLGFDIGGVQYTATPFVGW
jgi:nitric oxide synthase oxygenase domain/subunit